MGDLQVNPGSKAAQRGIREGDLITAINGESTKTLTSNEAHDLLKGSGSTLKLGLNEWVPLFHVVIAYSDLLRNFDYTVAYVFFWFDYTELPFTWVSHCENHSRCTICELILMRISAWHNNVRIHPNRRVRPNLHSTVSTLKHFCHRMKSYYEHAPAPLIDDSVLICASWGTCVM